MKLFSYSVILLLTTACTSRHTVIEGTLPNENYHDEWVYWVPYKDASSKTVDSARINKDVFKITIADNNRNKMGFVRLRPLLRFEIQEVIVYTEVGTTRLQLDSISSASGTPLNDVLQNWKDNKQKYDREIAALYRKLHNDDTTEEEINKAIENALATYRNYVCQIVLANKNNDAGKFIFSLHQSLLTPEQVQDLELAE
jgi:hypothetical protein